MRRLRITLKLLAILIWNTVLFGLILLLSPLLLLPVTKPKLERFVYYVWATGYCVICNFHLKVKNPPPKLPRGTLFVSNHMAMVDIWLLLRAFDVRMVSKEEVKYWPVVGQGAWLVGTLFIDRTSKRGLHQLVQVVGGRIGRGTNVLVFPEGTTGNGKTILPLNRPFFSLTERGIRTVPLFIAYTRVNGEPADPDRHKFLFYAKGVSLTQHMGYVLGCRRIDAEITVLPELDTGKSRKALVPELQEVYQAQISRQYGKTPGG
jgi:1-acyl-sn-glycerol-3-phosphate acyltransferase